MIAALQRNFSAIEEKQGRNSVNKGLVPGNKTQHSDNAIGKTPQHTAIFRLQIFPNRSISRQ